jgi:hypothetical protein
MSKSVGQCLQRPKEGVNVLQQAIRLLPNLSNKLSTWKCNDGVIWFYLRSVGTLMQVVVKDVLPCKVKLDHRLTISLIGSLRVAFLSLVSLD